MEEHENFNIELQRSRGAAIAVLGRRCMGRLLLREVLNATDRTSGPVICSYNYDRMGITGTGSQRRQSWIDQQIWLPGVSVSVVHGVEVYF